MTSAPNSQSEPIPQSTTPTDLQVIEGSARLELRDIEEGLGSLPRARIARWLGLLAPVLATAIMVYRWEEQRDRMMLGAVTGLLILSLLFMRNPTKRLAKRVFASLDEEAQKLTVRIDAEGIHLESSGNQTLLLWPQIWQVTESRGTILVFMSRANAQIIPKRAFCDSELTQFRAWVRASLVPRHEPWLTPDLRRRLTIWLVIVILVTIFMAVANR
jgi:hypothetical protein